MVDYVDKNFVDEGNPYVPTAHMYPKTGIHQAEYIKNEVDAISELIGFYQSEEEKVKERNNLALENENKRLENIEKERQNLINEEKNNEYRNWYKKELEKTFETAPWKLNVKSMRKIGINADKYKEFVENPDDNSFWNEQDKIEYEREYEAAQKTLEHQRQEAERNQPSQEFIDKQERADAFWADIERQEKSAKCFSSAPF